MVGLIDFLRIEDPETPLTKLIIENGKRTAPGWNTVNVREITLRYQRHLTRRNTSPTFLEKSTNVIININVWGVGSLGQDIRGHL